ncbi:hypothetical protein OSB04_024059 [Centaurea solstitialis]|uniref:non-specific serine/threonine protein kinase n=1 Tax=Centaurea solstitialis TaxID=347529 RepID=A0AA38W2T1_9ASTR|nr:hypothetical protein OSB04_024059 [Centaurea solstitialis]
MAYLLLYVDDIILTASNTKLLQRFITKLSKEFAISDLGTLHHFLGIEVTKRNGGLFLSQATYVANILSRGNMTDCKPCATLADAGSKLSATDGEPLADGTLYRSLAGALQYLTFTRLDIAYVVQQACLYMHAPRDIHFSFMKWILRYLKGSVENMVVSSPLLILVGDVVSYESHTNRSLTNPTFSDGVSRNFSADKSLQFYSVNGRKRKEGNLLSLNRPLPGKPPFLEKNKAKKKNNRCKTWLLTDRGKKTQLLIQETKKGKRGKTKYNIALINPYIYIPITMMMMKDLFSLAIFLLTVFNSPFHVVGSSNEVDALLRWKASLRSQKNTILLPSWTDDDQRTMSLCSNWHGVSCNSHGSINRLNLSSSGLSGTLDQFSFPLFPNLTHFELSLNHFTGIIPSEIGYLSKLVYLDFSSNQFSGIIPPEIGHLRNLVTLYLFDNKLINGSIPETICQMRSLSGLALYNNMLSGSIPTCLGQLLNLSYIYLNYNNISGSIPYEIGNLSHLEKLYINNNHLTGSIPTSFVNLKKLTLLILCDNHLNGSIPTEIGKLYSLRKVELQTNNLSGPIPRSLGKLRSLSLLRLFSNKLFGPLPQELGNLVSLSALELGVNQLNGSIPPSIRNLQNLNVFSLRNNRFSGPIPQELGKLKLIRIDISNNRFSSYLPDNICNGGKLEMLLVGDNNLTGRIPKSLYNCSSLRRLRFDGNQITGDLSESFGVYPHLSYINLDNNMVFGKLSNSWSKCTNLTTMQMGGNRISGSIPPFLSPKLQVLNLSSNDLVGEIPKEFGRMSGLVNLYLSNNQLSGVVPMNLGSLAELSYLDLSVNKFNGQIPSSLGSCSKLFHLNLSNNVFTHEIPVEIGRLFHLSVLDLSHNSLTGELPSSLSSLTSLETLNLSHNQLSGYIPRTMKSMNALWSIDLSYNLLEGPIPVSKGFMNASIEGNKGLCGNGNRLQQCESKPQTPNVNHKLAILISLPLVGALLFGGALGIFIFYWRKRMPSMNEEDKPHKDFFSISTFDGRETYHQILEATEEFNGAYCIGKGGCGSVYKAKMASGETVAVKRLHSSSEMVSRDDFFNEIRALTRIRHRNIVKLHGYCLHAQNSLLVYEYLEGGSLAESLKWDEIAQNFNWNKRVNVIKGVAHALSYMHHDCSPAIVHRDISSKNILLDLECEACVSDFGTSKILNQESSNWSNIAGTYGYLAPELGCSMKVTEKCDVYSFGVLTVEVIKGEHPGDIITDLLSPSTKKMELEDLLDDRLGVPNPEMKKVVTSILVIAIECLNLNPEIRPTMYDVSQKIACLTSNM